MISIGASLHFSPRGCISKSHARTGRFKISDVHPHCLQMLVFYCPLTDSDAYFQTSETKRLLRGASLSSHAVQRDSWSLHVSNKIHGPLYVISYRYNIISCRSQSFPTSGCSGEVSLLKSASLALSRSYNALCGYPLLLQLLPPLGLTVFAVWGLGPLLCQVRKFFVHNDSSWKKSRTHYVFASYLQPMFLWTACILFCRALDPVVLPSQASQAIKGRLLHFVRSLSSVLAFAYCLSSLIHQIQKLPGETNEHSDAQNMGFQFAVKAVYTAVWVAAASLFMELLGFSTQKWLTAGGLGTVLLTLAGREIFTNFLSSMMIHATRPFVLNEWIQTKIDGYEVSGTVERVGWWSPTIIRGDDREAVHIPNHKFTVNIVRNLSQRTHWRVKTHFAISHLDAKKIRNIVADMRKVVAKNPQVEQQKLHRRVFLEYINPENQAFMILISCFVKTKHFEEFLGVKEAILLDLLRVVSHHRARLATPIRTVQKMYNNEGLEDVPFADAFVSSASAHMKRPLYLVETTSRANSDDFTGAPTDLYVNGEQLLKDSTTLDQKATSSAPVESSAVDKQQKVTVTIEPSSVSDGSGLSSVEDNQQQKLKSTSATTNSSAKSQVQGLDSRDLGTTIVQPPATNKSESGSERETGAASSSKMHVKHEKEKATAAPSPITRPSSLDDNIVLGVVLDGSKRTLPIDEVSDSSTAEMRGLNAHKNGEGSPAASAGTSSSGEHRKSPKSEK